MKKLFILFVSIFAFFSSNSTSDWAAIEALNRLKYKMFLPNFCEKRNSREIRKIIRVIKQSFNSIDLLVDITCATKLDFDKEDTIIQELTELGDFQETLKEKLSEIISNGKSRKILGKARRAYERIHRKINERNKS